MTRGRLLRAALYAFCAVLLCALTIAARAAKAEVDSLEPSPHAVVRPPGEEWLAAAADLTLAIRAGVELRGWRIPSANGAAVLFVEGSGSDRTQLLPEARILHRAGYGVVLFDLPASGESGGRKRRGDEQDFLRGVVGLLSSSPDVDPKRIGAYAFSGGAAILASVAESDTRIRAAVLAGCYTDTEAHIRHDYRRWGPLSALPALWAARWVGLVALNPLRSVPLIAPRALLFIAGDADPIVPSESSVRLYDAAGQPKELWIVHGAGHGGYGEAARDEYERRLVGFFDRAL